MRRKKNSESTENITKTNNNGLIAFLSFVALIITAVIIFVNNLLPVFDLNEQWTNILTTISGALTVIIISLNAWSFAKNKGKGIKITFLISFLIYIASIVFVWIF